MMSGMADRAAAVSAAQFAQIYQQCKNWGRWGADDQRGALNLITPERVVAAAGLVRAGQTVSCAWPLDTSAGPDNPRPVLHYMTILPDTHLGDNGDLRFAGDFVGVEFHGDAHSHLDALCHVAYQGRLYNGVPAREAVTSQGASRQDVEVAKDKITSRGVLLDIPHVRHTRWLEPGDFVYPEDLQAAEELAGTRLRDGDIALVRTGHARRRVEQGPWDAARSKTGLHCMVMLLLHERGIAAIGYDGDGETIPSQCDGVSNPIHAIGINAMGLHFMDSLWLEDLSAACHDHQRWQFLFVVAPLRLTGGTGSPVNPIAIL
jgi:kynurenine formamidase